MSVDFGTVLTGAFIAIAGGQFASMGWRGVRRRVAPVEPGDEPAPPPPMSSPAWKLLWLFCLLFGLFALGCGLILMIGPFLPEQHR